MQYFVHNKSSVTLSQIQREGVLFLRYSLPPLLFHTRVLTHVSKGRVACWRGGSAVAFGHGRNEEGAERRRRELVLLDWPEKEKKTIEFLAVHTGRKANKVDRTWTRNTEKYTIQERLEDLIVSLLSVWNWIRIIEHDKKEILKRTCPKITYLLN